MLICTVGDIALHLLEHQDAKWIEALKENYTSYDGEWLYAGRVEDYIKESLQRFAEQRGFCAAIWTSNTLVGVLNLKIPSPRSRCASVGYMLGAGFRGRGIMTRSLSALISYGFDHLQLNRFEIHCEPGNVKSCALPERLGFCKEGVLRQKNFYGDRFGDEAIYAMLASEWIQKKNHTSV